MAMARRALVLAAACLLAACCAQAADMVAVVRRSALVGPNGIGARSFSDWRYYADGSPITKVAFSVSSVTGNSGLAVWYNGKKVTHGAAVPDAAAEAINTEYPIKQVEVQYVEDKDEQQGQFLSFTFTTAYQSFTLGSRVGNNYAKSVSWKAPAGAYLGGFYGMASNDTLKLLQFVWVKALPPVVTVVGATTPWYTTGYTSNVDYFDDTKTALSLGGQGITQIGALLKSDGVPSTGLAFVYNDKITLAHGAPVTLTSPPITSRITRVHGSFAVAVGSKPGFWGHLTFSTATGVNITFGTPVNQELGRSREFVFNTPKGQWLGAVRGWATATQLRSISFVCFRNTRQGS